MTSLAGANLRRGPLAALALAVALLWGAAASGASPPDGAPPRFSGRVIDAAGNPVVGAMVTFEQGDPIHASTVFSDADGRYRSPRLAPRVSTRVRVRRIGWRDLRVDDPAAVAGDDGALDLPLERETDPAAVAAQLPANHWYGLVLARMEDPVQKEELKRQCTYCHQQGNRATRIVRDAEEWRKVLLLMGRMGGMVSPELRAVIPDLFNEAYAPENAIPALTARMNEPDFAPPPPTEVRRALIEEWELGGRASMQHDLVVHPDGRIYSVDMNQDQLFRLDPRAPGATREHWTIPHGDLPLGGAFATVDSPLTPNTNAHVGPHSLQVAGDGSVWITLALGNQLARFDPESEEFEIFPLVDGYYPHTLRFDPRGRIWFTLAASNHVGMLDPATRDQVEIRLPAASFAQAVTLRALPALLFLGRYFDLRGAAAESNPMVMPIPYGIDVAPDGGIWVSQLNQRRIGRIDPDSFDVEMLDTPFPAPRRLRFDSRGKLWIPSFSGGLISRFDPGTREFESWDLPIEPLGSDVPYALNVDRRSDTVWICGTNSDTLIRFDPETEVFTVFPLPTRVTYTREIDFDAEGRIWTSNSNAPTWQIEGGVARVLRLDPDG
ncbi:MAG: carboxypeptidase regulatory-like domain-containing protein [Proteobacteria bacterium]|nr:carboxypeptidase regulatory-like domain-containing protein [Pseudomonadota bacterium]